MNYLRDRNLARPCIWLIELRLQLVIASSKRLVVMALRSSPDSESSMLQMESFTSFLYGGGGVKYGGLTKRTNSTVLFYYAL